MLRQTHYPVWEKGIKLGLGEQLIKLQRFKSKGNINYLDFALNAEDAVENRPCAFDVIGEHIVGDQLTLSDYDSEAITQAV